MLDIHSAKVGGSQECYRELMDTRTKQLLRDTVFIALSILFAVFLQTSGIADRVAYVLSSIEFLGVFFAGLFFTSIFTTATSIVILMNLAETVPLPILAFVGGLGAVSGDFILFRLMRNTIVDDVDYLLSFTRNKRFFSIFRTKLFRLFIPLLGALIIASPFPDELGIALLSMSHINSKFFVLISYAFNSLGIHLIGLVGLSIAS